jgi:hypothetical protein
MKVCDVGFIGLAGAGKDTAALCLIAHGWRRRAFADYLKSLAFSFGWNGYKDEKGRKLLQDLGMAARAYNPNFWIDQAYLGLVGINENFAKVPMVWTDVRFENEAEFIRKRGGIIIRIKKPEQISCDQHESELNQFGIAADHDVVNGGSIQELHDQILNILKHDTL